MHYVLYFSLLFSQYSETSGCKLFSDHKCAKYKWFTVLAMNTSDIWLILFLSWSGYTKAQVYERDAVWTKNVSFIVSDCIGR